MPAELGELGRTVIIASEPEPRRLGGGRAIGGCWPVPGLLLTASDALDPRLATYLADQEIEHVVLVGGTSAIAPAVQTAIEAAGAAVTRLAGEDRYHTAALAMDLLADAARCASNTTDSIGLALGDEPQLALTAGRLLGPRCIPLLFTEAGRLALVTQNHLYLYRHRTGIEPSWHLIGDDVTIDPSAIEHPPVRMATVADNPDGDGQHIVVLDEHHQARHYLTESGFDQITYVVWAADRSVVEFIGIRDGERSSYDLNIHNGTVEPESPSPRWYAPLVRDEWVDPKPSRDREYIIFRAPIENYAGHSLFAFHVDSGEVRQLTHNRSNDVHHVSGRGWPPDAIWLPDRERLIATDEDIAHPPCGNRPQQRARIVNVEDGDVQPLPHGGHLVDDPFVFSPDGRYLAVKSYEEYEFAPERDLFMYWFWICSHDGTGTPSIQVYDISGPEPRSVNDSGLRGHDPMWSPDSRYLVFRSPVEGTEGHSLFALDAESAQVTRLTHNESDEHHHVARQWLLNENRLLYTAQRIDQLEASCIGLPPSQMRREGVPHYEAHIVDLEDGHSAQLEYEGLTIGSGSGAGLGQSPDGRFLYIHSYSDSYYYDAQGGCSYFGTGGRRLHVYDIGARPPRRVTFDGESAWAGLWSPDSRFLAFSHRQRGTSATTNSILDTQDGSIWGVPASDTYGFEANLDDVAWLPDSSRLLYRVALDDYSSATDAAILADVTSKRIFSLGLPEERGVYLQFDGFSPDGLQAVHAEENTNSDTAGSFYISNVAGRGELLAVYNVYASTAPAEPARRYADEPGGDPYREFRFWVEWDHAGIYAAGEFSIRLYDDF